MAKKTAKKITTDDLAIMVKKGFDNTAEDIGGFKSDFLSFKNETNDNFKDVKRRFDRIENIILAKHEHRIDMLEERIKEIGAALSI